MGWEYIHTGLMLFNSIPGNQVWTLEGVPPDRWNASWLHDSFEQPHSSLCRISPKHHPRRGLELQGSVEARLGLSRKKCLSGVLLQLSSSGGSQKNFEYLPGPFSGDQPKWKIIVMTTPFQFPRKNRTKTDDIFVEKTLLDLELMYGSTEAGRLSSKTNDGSTEPCWLLTCPPGNTLQTSKSLRRDELTQTARPYSAVRSLFKLDRYMGGRG